MDVTFNPSAKQISPMRTGRFAPPEGRESKTAGQFQDKLEISGEGQQAAAAAPGFDQSWEKLEANLGRMTQDEFMSAVREQSDRSEFFLTRQ